MSASFDKEYLPGYTGHVPKKNELFGRSAGQINKIITQQDRVPLEEVDVITTKPQYNKNDYLINPPAADDATDELKYGNASQRGAGWIGGPTNNLKAQHVPGYSGYIPAVASENLFGKSFAKTSGAAINKEYVKGHNPPPQEVFKTE